LDFAPVHNNRLEESNDREKGGEESYLGSGKGWISIHKELDASTVFSCLDGPILLLLFYREEKGGKEVGYNMSTLTFSLFQVSHRSLKGRAMI
jgi:hypothetical protein